MRSVNKRKLAKLQLLQHVKRSVARRGRAEDERKKGSKKDAQTLKINIPGKGVPAANVAVNISNNRMAGTSCKHRSISHNIEHSVEFGIGQHNTTQAPCSGGARCTASRAPSPSKTSACLAPLSHTHQVTPPCRRPQTTVIEHLITTSSSRGWVSCWRRHSVWRPPRVLSPGHGLGSYRPQLFVRLGELESVRV